MHVCKDSKVIEMCLVRECKREIERCTMHCLRLPLCLPFVCRSMGQCVWEGVCVCLLWLVVSVCVLEDRGCSHYHVVCVISRLAAAVGRLHRLPCCQHYSLPPSPAITHHTMHTHTPRRARCGCAWPRQNAAELYESIHIHNVHSIELKSNQRIDNWEWWRKKKLFLHISLYVTEMNQPQKPD